jgi:hypothetical protein
MTTNASTVVGRAVYCEFTKNGGTRVVQLLIMPEGYNTQKRLVPMTAFRRSLSVVQPRKSWRMLTAHATSPSARLTAAPPDATDEVRHKATAEYLLKFLNTSISSLETNSYELKHDPIVVEVTAEDLDCSAASKTPYKVLGRVHKVRKAMGMPKDIVPKSVEPSSF